MKDQRIDILKNILLELHNGASPESVQDQFNQHFTGVSALEISMMEHELMSSDTGITFEDVMGLCNIHANLFKGAIADVEVADMDQEGHPVYVFKQENLALRAARGARGVPAVVGAVAVVVDAVAVGVGGGVAGDRRARVDDAALLA